MLVEGPPRPPKLVPPGRAALEGNMFGGQGAHLILLPPFRPLATKSAMEYVLFGQNM